MSATMSFEEEVLRRLIAIDNRQVGIDDSLGWLVHAEDELNAKMLAAFGSSRRRVQVYLALDGVKNVNNVAVSLKMLRQNVTNELRWLMKRRLVEMADSDQSGTIYKKKSFDAIVGLSDALMEKFKLDRGGRPIKRK